MAASNTNGRIDWRKRLAILALGTVAGLGLGAAPALADWHHEGWHGGGWERGHAWGHRDWHAYGWRPYWRPWLGLGYYAPPPVAYAPPPAYYQGAPGQYDYAPPQ